jgi:hypothetical protein
MKYILIFLSLFFYNNLSAQPASVKTFVDKDSVLLGEPFELTLEIRAPKNSDVMPFKIDSIPHFELLKKDSISKKEEGDFLIIKQYFQLTSFDSGQWVIPPFALNPFSKTNSILINVVFTTPFNPDQPYHDIRNIRSVPINKKQILLWMARALAICLCIVIVIYFITNKKWNIFLPRKKDLPYEIAMANLKKLKANQTNEKLIYENLVNIFRSYIFKTTGIQSFSQTSNDLIKKIKPLYDEGKDAANYNRISQILLISDFVKFAKYHPDKTEVQWAFDAIIQSVNFIEKKRISSNNEKDRRMK